MGWDIDLRHPETGEPAAVEPFLFGSNVLLWRTSEGAELWMRAGKQTREVADNWERSRRENPGRLPIAAFSRPLTLYLPPGAKPSGFGGGLPAGHPIRLTGQDRAHVCITFNYGQHYHFGVLDGMTGRESQLPLLAAVRELGTERTADYWEATAGNVGYACGLLLGWAERHPDYIWDVRG